MNNELKKAYVLKLKFKIGNVRKKKSISILAISFIEAIEKAYTIMKNLGDYKFYYFELYEAWR